MAVSVANVEPRTPTNTLRSRLDDIRAGSANLRIDANPVGPATDADEGPVDVLELLQRVKAETNTSSKAMAIAAECTESMLSEAFHRRRNFDIEWVWRQSDRFVLRFFEVAMEARGLTPENARAIRVSRIKELIAHLLTEVA